MSDRPPARRTDDDGVALSAYLAGDLDAAETAALERRLADDPALAARLDTTADVVARLRRLDEVAPPQGYETRLRARLAAARAPAAVEGDDAVGADIADRDGGSTAARPAAVAALDDARRRRRRWSQLGAAAAVLTLVALGSLAVVQSGGGGDERAAMLAQETARDVTTGGAAADAPAEEAAPPAASAPREAAPEAFAEDAGQQAPAVPPADAGDRDAGTQDAVEGADGGAAPPVPPADEAMVAGPPVVDDTYVPVADEAGLRTAFAGLPEVEAALGTPLGQARDDAVATHRALATAPSVGGSLADACLPTVLEGRDPGLVARVQSVDYAGEVATAFVVVSSRGGAVLDHADVVVVRPATCAVLAAVPLTG